MKNFEKLYKILMNESDAIEDSTELNDVESELETPVTDENGEQSGENSFSDDEIAEIAVVYTGTVKSFQSRGKEINPPVIMGNVLDALDYPVELADEALAKMEELGLDEEDEVAPSEEVDELGQNPDAPTQDDITDINPSLRDEYKQREQDEEDLYNRPDQD